MDFRTKLCLGAMTITGVLINMSVWYQIFMAISNGQHWIAGLGILCMIATYSFASILFWPQFKSIINKE